jgi:hypothetical protein
MMGKSELHRYRSGLASPENTHNIGRTDSDSVLAAMLLATRVIEPIADRWGRGVGGERKVGAILEGLGPEWHVLHGVFS